MSLTLRWDRERYTLFTPDSPRRRGENFFSTKVKTIDEHIHIVRNDSDGTCAVLKMARAREISALKKEAQFYQHELLHLQGRYVPEFYGIYFGTMFGTPVACMLLEWCRGEPPLDQEEINRQVMLAACALHQAGVVHNDLVDGHHFIPVGGGGIRIIDFSQAERHHCGGGTPILYPGRRPADSADETSCMELMQLEQAYGMFSGAQIPAPSLVNRIEAALPAGHPLRILGRAVGISG